MLSAARRTLSSSSRNLIVYRTTNRHSSTSTNNSMASNLSWATASAKQAGVGGDLLEKTSTVFVPSDEVGGLLLAAALACVRAGHPGRYQWRQ
jgi:hypothetical protein